MAEQIKPIQENTGKEKPKTPEEELADFRAEIQEIKDRELSGELKSAHLIDTSFGAGVDVTKLSENDMQLWQEFNSGDLTKEKLDAHKAELRKRRAAGENTHDADEFAAFVSNKIANWEIYHRAHSKKAK